MPNMILSRFACFFTGILLFLGYPRADQNLQVNITNLRNNKGAVLVSLFKDGVGYPDNPAKAYRTDKAYIVEKKATIIFKELPPGNYAIAILHDENNNQKMDKNMLGIPKEGYGFSNNVTGTFGPPAYNKASFRHKADKAGSLVIRARY